VLARLGGRSKRAFVSSGVRRSQCSPVGWAGSSLVSMGAALLGGAVSTGVPYSPVASMLESTGGACAVSSESGSGRVSAPKVMGDVSGSV
jgi:hypothetical protein